MQVFVNGILVSYVQKHNRDDRRDTYFKLCNLLDKENYRCIGYSELGSIYYSSNANTTVKILLSDKDGKY